MISVELLDNTPQIGCALVEVPFVLSLDPKIVDRWHFLGCIDPCPST